MNLKKRSRIIFKMIVLGLVAFLSMIPTFENYKKLLTNMYFLRTILNSFILSTGGTFIALIVGVLAGYGLSRFKFKGSGIFSYMILILRTVPPIVFVIPYFLIWRNLRLNDTHLSMILMYITLCLPLIILMMRSFFIDVPIEIEEAAMVDGCSRWKTLSLILVPAVAPGIMAAATMAFITLWNDFIFAMYNTGKNTRTLPVEIYSSLGYYQMDWAKLSTSAVIAIIPAIIFIAFTQKYIVRGLTMGAVKG
jgi:multiple sugar transport system permease protein